MSRKLPAKSYKMRVAEVNRIYVPSPYLPIGDSKSGVLVIYPVYGICEKTFYNLLNAPAKPGFSDGHENQPSLFDLLDGE